MIKRESIITEIKTELSSILVLNGYYTNAGNNVYLDRSSFDESETMPFINIAENEDSIVEQSGKLPGNKLKLSLPLAIEATDKCDPLNPSPYGHKLIADIKKNLFSKSWSANIKEIQYQSSTIAQHENGAAYVNVSVNIDVNYIETIGNPEE